MRCSADARRNERRGGFHKNKSGRMDLARRLLWASGPLAVRALPRDGMASGGTASDAGVQALSSPSAPVSVCREEVSIAFEDGDFGDDSESLTPSAPALDVGDRQETSTCVASSADWHDVAAAFLRARLPAHVSTPLAVRLAALDAALLDMKRELAPSLSWRRFYARCQELGLSAATGEAFGANLRARLRFSEHLRVPLRRVRGASFRVVRRACLRRVW